ncbi:hypothetical protein [Oceanicoccus sp. KOV_DT_Chl]|nr:hypothetical protein [Oceanicoccus sp. KOV_DT_Chl]
MDEKKNPIVEVTAAPKPKPELVAEVTGDEPQAEDSETNSEALAD